MLNTVANTSNFYHFRVKEGGPIVGQFSLVDQGNDNELRIVSLSIYGKYRNKGYGQQLIQEAITEANRIRGNRLLTLNVEKQNHKALHIYKKFGFEIAGDYHREAYAMVYQLHKQPTMKVVGIECVETRPFYDSQWLVKFKNKSWCVITRYDTDDADEIIKDVETCRCISEVKTKCDFRNKILYD